MMRENGCTCFDETTRKCHLHSGTAVLRNEVSEWTLGAKYKVGIIDEPVTLIACDLQSDYCHVRLESGVVIRNFLRHHFSGPIRENK